MTLHGRIQNGAVVLDQSLPLPEGAEVRVEILEIGSIETPLLDDQGQTLGDRLLRFAGKAVGLPPRCCQKP